MSKGPGKVQRAIIETYREMPSARLTVIQLAKMVYPQSAIEKRHTDAVHRALLKLEPEIGLKRCRCRLPNSLGWRHVWGTA